METALVTMGAALLAMVAATFVAVLGSIYELADKNHAEVTGSLADARERLARIEGHMGIGIPPPNPTGPSH